MVSSELETMVQEIKSCLSEEAVVAATGFPSLPPTPFVHCESGLRGASLGPLFLGLSSRGTLPFP